MRPQHTLIETAGVSVVFLGSASDLRRETWYLGWGIRLHLIDRDIDLTQPPCVSRTLDAGLLFMNIDLDLTPFRVSSAVFISVCCRKS